MTRANAPFSVFITGRPPEKRLHEGIGYVTPDDEHAGRGDAIRAARRDGLAAADQARRSARRAGLS